ncbi:hypothetical protein M3661_01235 [Paenibacillus sp. MER 180]|uniref:hypothetical protein n=1 Tax=Paenibacillus sp. MER 180 TaxID=2939570 RepID=UPI00203D43BE|nr:hypothetical protein [Paenibacillus sp. MER 180]MCM3288755.1 hypothetical protein [Paenibacillus sp. MER 180]
MPKSGKYIMIIAGILIIGLIGVFLYHINNERTFPFNELLREHFKEKEIESIFIQKFVSAADYSDTLFTDKKDIEFFMQSLPEIQIRSDSSSHGFPEYPTYEILIKGKNEKLFLAFIISSRDILMHDYEKKENYSYKIENEFRLDKLEFLDPFLVKLK